jgi:hypothetical protein
VEHDGGGGARHGDPGGVDDEREEDRLHAAEAAREMNSAMTGSPPTWPNGTV